MQIDLVKHIEKFCNKIHLLNLELSDNEPMDGDETQNIADFVRDNLDRLNGNK